MNNVIKLPDFRYLISLNAKQSINCEEQGKNEDYPSIKKTNFLATALDIASSDPRASEIFDSNKGQIIFQKRKLF